MKSIIICNKKKLKVKQEHKYMYFVEKDWQIKKQEQI